jgi:hypothetical protein
MPYGPHLSEDDLRSRVREGLRDGQLPIAPSEEVFAGYGGTGDTCRELECERRTAAGGTTAKRLRGVARSVRILRRSRWVEASPRRPTGPPSSRDLRQRIRTVALSSVGLLDYLLPDVMAGKMQTERSPG